MNTVTFYDRAKTPNDDKSKELIEKRVRDANELNKLLWGYVKGQIQYSINSSAFLSYLQENFPNCGRRSHTPNDPVNPDSFIEEILIEKRRLHVTVCKGYFLFVRSIGRDSALIVNGRDMLSEKESQTAA